MRWLLRGLALAVLYAGCATSRAPAPQPPSTDAPACAGDVGFINTALCQGKITTHLSDCVICEKASGCIANDEVYCVRHEYSCGDPYCADSPVNFWGAHGRADGGAR